MIERVFYRRLTSAGGGYTVAGMGMVIVGFGMSIVLQNVAFLIWGPKPLPFPVPFGRPIEIGKLTLPMSYVWIVVTALTLMFVLNLVLRKTMIGLAMRAVAHNKDIAYLSGVNVPLMISIIFGIACALGAAAGVLIAPINYVQVQMGIGILIKAFAAAVVGGFGSLPGAVLGGLLVGVVESLGAGYRLGHLQGHLRVHSADRRADGEAVRNSRRRGEGQGIGMKTAIATVCLSGSLDEKLDAIAAAGFKSVEIFENDLLSFAGTNIDARNMCADLGLDIITFQPFRDFEGIARAAARARFRPAPSASST